MENPLIYPVKRILNQYYSHNIFNKDKTHVPSFNQITQDVKRTTGYFGGFASFATSVLISKAGSIFLGVNPLVTYYLLAAATYPLQYNSLLKSLNMPEARPLTSALSMMTEKTFYRGLCANLLANIVSNIPLVNYIFYNPIEQTRIAYILGRYNGQEFNSYKDAYNYIKENGNLQRGRGFANNYFHFYNAFAIIMLLNVINKRHENKPHITAN
jgi:hypothetical protein